MKIPERMCVLTRQMKPKTELIRLVKKDGQIFVDEKQKMSGRGVWLSKDLEILKNLEKSKCLNRAFKCEINDDVYQKVRSLCTK